MTNFTPGAIDPANVALERLRVQLALAANAIISALVDVRGYTLDSFLPDHASDILDELMALDPGALGVIVDADNPVTAADAQLNRLPNNALFPADPTKAVPRYVARETNFDRASADAHVSYAGPGELRRETRAIADMHGIDLWSIADKAREIAAREAALKAEADRLAEKARMERVRAKGRASDDVMLAPPSRKTIFG